jgi:hypothetical protein
VNVRLGLSLALVLSLVCGVAASQQLRPLTINQVQSEMQSITIFGNLSEIDVAGAAYSAIEEKMYSKKQPDGRYLDTTLTATHIYRDSQGRTRAERYMTSYRGNGDRRDVLQSWAAGPAFRSRFSVRML